MARRRIPHEECPYTSNALLAGGDKLYDEDGCCLFCLDMHVACFLRHHPFGIVFRKFNYFSPHV